MARRKPRRKAYSLPEIEGPARAVVAEAFSRLVEDAEVAIDSAKTAVKIADIPMTVKQLAYWRNVVRALKWAHWRILRVRFGERVDVDSPPPKPR